MSGPRCHKCDRSGPGAYWGEPPLCEPCRQLQARAVHLLRGERDRWAECGAMAGEATADPEHVTCGECMATAPEFARYREICAALGRAEAENMERRRQEARGAV